MLKRLYVDNYRCFVNFHLELQELTLLVGSNGSGKSSVLAVMFALRKLLSGTGKVNDPDVFPTHTLTRWQARPAQATQVFEIVVNLDLGRDVTYRLEIEHEREAGGRVRIHLESLKLDGKPLFEFRYGEVQLYRDNHSQGPTYGADWSESAMARVVPRGDNKHLSRFLELMRGVSLCAFNPKVFIAESMSEDARLEPDGRNFASWYRHQSQERQDLIPGVIQALRKVIPDFQSIRLEKVGSEARKFTIDFEGQGGRYDLGLDELSDGQRLLIALYALLYLGGEQNLLLLDEPTNYLALAEIQPWVIALADACGSRPRQAVLCSHHPELIDYLGAESGVLLQRESSGSIRARRLSEVPVNGGLKLSEVFARGWEE
jgi:predicted ATPase